MLEEDGTLGCLSLCLMSILHVFAWKTAFSFIVDVSRQSRNEDLFDGGHRILAGVAESAFD